MHTYSIESTDTLIGKIANMFGAKLTNAKNLLYNVIDNSTKKLFDNHASIEQFTKYFGNDFLTSGNLDKKAARFDELVANTFMHEMLMVPPWRSVDTMLAMP